MRAAFFKTLLDLAERDERIHLVVGDLGFGVVEPFARRFPDRFLNAGVAEQNMTGVAAGLALCGKVVFTYSIGNFSTIRCLEQIRNDICYHRADVKIVSVGGGFAYGPLGMTHHALEDLAIMRVLPGMTGLWQVSGRNLLTYRQMCELDVAYVRSWSLWLDIRILLRTVPVVLFNSGRAA